MTEKRFKRYLLDGGFWFDEYVKPVWAINDTVDKNSPITHLEFKDKYKDLCDEVIDLLNKLSESITGCNKTAYNALETIKALTKENEELKKELHLMHMRSMFSTVKSFKGNVSERYTYSEKTDNIYDTANHYGQYHKILDKKEIVMLLNEYETIIKELKELKE